MKFFLKRIGSLVAIAVLGISFCGVDIANAEKEQRFITIGTGGVTGVYYPTGGAICRLVNINRKEHGIRCSVESTGASVYNINTIRAGELDFGVAQSDVQYHAYHAEAEFAGKEPYKDLRSVFSLHPEAFTVVARADANVSQFQELEGKRVNIGNPGSGQRATLDVILKASGKDSSIYSLASELKASEMASALCDNKIDAMIYFVGHPSGSIKEATTTCESKLVNVSGPDIDKIVAAHSYYRHAIIPGGMYKGNPDDTKTFGVAATIVTSAKTPDDVVYHLVKAVFDNFDTFVKLHPAFANLKKEEMITAGLSAPLHDGAVRYYREIGLLK